MGAPEAGVNGRPRCLFVADASFVAPFAFSDESHPLFTMFSLSAFLAQVSGYFGFIGSPVGELLSTHSEVFYYLSSFLPVG